MNKIFKKTILFIAILGIFLLPISPSFEIKKDGEVALGVRTNEAQTQAIPHADVTIMGDVIKDISASFKIEIKNTVEKYENSDGTNKLTYKLFDKHYNYLQAKPADVTLLKTGKIPFSPNTASQTLNLSLSWPEITLTANTPYFLYVYIMEGEIGWVSGTVGTTSFASVDFTTAADANSSGTIDNTDSYVSYGGVTITPSLDPLNPSLNIDNSFFECNRTMTGFNWLDLPCQLVYVSYELIFVPLSWLAGLAGKFMDYFIYYSTNSDSYKSEFVGKAWGAVRDIANIFFIIALLYIALKMILSLGDSHSKKLISTIIIVALIINFSMFFTQVIIDGSNILAKVFYNNIEVKNQDGTNADINNGAKSISAGLVANFNPQKVFNDAGIHEMSKNLSLFFVITALMSAILGFMIFMFVSVALLFVARVVGLWIAMVFAPIAFASYTVPFDIPGFGHKKWWENLLKQAFLAPIFIFFLYVIYLFSGAISSSVKDVTLDGQVGLQAFMKVIIPMAIIFIMLQQAKKLAVEYSGELGAAIQKVGAMAGGLAIGAAAGAGAMALRGTLGRAGNNLANSEWVKTHGVFGRGLQNIGTTLGKGSFDARKTAAGAGLAKASGMNFESAKGIGLGSKEGGYTKYRADKVKRRQERAKRLEVGEDEKLTQVVNKAEMDLQVLLNQTTKEFERIDKALVAARQEKADTKSGSIEEQNAIDKIKALNDRKTFIKTGVPVGAIAGVSPAFGAVTVRGGINDGKTIKQMENDVIPDAKNEKLTESRKRTTKYAEEQALFGGKANKEAEHKIIMETKLDSGTKT